MTIITFFNAGSMFAKLLTTLAVVVIIMTCAVLFFRKTAGLQTRWEGAFRHIIALMAGWVAFSLLFFLGLVIALFESDAFSLPNMLDALNKTLLILLCGMGVMFVPFVLLRKSRSKTTRD